LRKGDGHCWLGKTEKFWGKKWHPLTRGCRRPNMGFGGGKKTEANEKAKKDEPPARRPSKVRATGFGAQNWLLWLGNCLLVGGGGGLGFVGSKKKKLKEGESTNENASMGEGKIEKGPGEQLKREKNP